MLSFFSFISEVVRNGQLDPDQLAQPVLGQLFVIGRFSGGCDGRYERRVWLFPRSSQNPIDTPMKSLG
jgi:hypothetical protein